MTDTNLVDDLGRYREHPTDRRATIRAAGRLPELPAWDPVDPLNDPVDAQLVARHVANIAREVSNLTRRATGSNPATYRQTCPRWPWLAWPVAFPALELQAVAAICAAHARRLAGADTHGVTARHGTQAGTAAPTVRLEVADNWLNLRRLGDRVAITTGPASLPLEAGPDDLRGLAAWLDTLADRLEEA